jgi:hypothetical protein
MLRSPPRRGKCGRGILMTTTAPHPDAAEPAADAPTRPNLSRIAPRPRITPLWAIMLLTFVNSVGGGVVTTGFSFLADSAYGFTPVQNYGLGLMQGVLYVVAALTAGPVLGWLMRVAPGMSHRTALGGLMVGLGLLCVLPVAARAASGGSGGAWGLWVLIGGYSALTGALWPIVESYMSGGRRGGELRRAAGLFNVVWSSALVAAFWVMGPLKRDYSLELVLGVAGLHLVCLALLPLFARTPAAHVHEDHAAAPEVYSRLLGVFRTQLVTSYMVYSAITPFLPLACRELQLVEGWQTPIAATWLLTRVLTFALLQSWHGWHGRWMTTGVGAAALVLGFVAVVIAPLVGDAAGRAVGITSLVGGLGVFGVGMGVIYCAAIYYAMSVGNAEVDAGGKHEALIGLGYGGGPVCGLAAIWAQSAGWLGSGAPLGRVFGERFETLMLAMVATTATVLIGWSLWRARGHADRARRGADRNPSGSHG